MRLRAPIAHRLSPVPHPEYLPHVTRAVRERLHRLYRHVRVRLLDRRPERVRPAAHAEVVPLRGDERLAVRLAHRPSKQTHVSFVGRRGVDGLRREHHVRALGGYERVQVTPVAGNVREPIPGVVGYEIRADVGNGQRADHLGIVVAQRHPPRAPERGDDAGHAVAASELQDVRAVEPRAVGSVRGAQEVPGEVERALPELEPALVLAPHEVAPPRDVAVGAPEGVRGVRGRHRALDHGDELVEFDEFGSPPGERIRDLGREHLRPGDATLGGLLLLVLVLSTRGWVHRGRHVRVAAEVEAEPAALSVLRAAPHRPSRALTL
mmetsp:Transcript_13991/g.55424  ORF Transcript_13991/g.55424 Transcript_13991/m.55424 type:complete len:322 (+) Transcript_13991:53-1018(+)